jgi:hypothetical protein
MPSTPSPGHFRGPIWIASRPAVNIPFRFWLSSKSISGLSDEQRRADLDDWEVITGERQDELSADELLALQALRHDTIASRREAGDAERLAGILERPGRRRLQQAWILLGFGPCGSAPTDRSKEPWGARLSKQLRLEGAWEAERDDDFPARRWYLLTVTKSFRSAGSSFADTMAALALLGKSWGRITREVQEDGIGPQRAVLWRERTSPGTGQCD